MEGHSKDTTPRHEGEPLNVDEEAMEFIVEDLAELDSRGRRLAMSTFISRSSSMAEILHRGLKG